MPSIDDIKEALTVTGISAFGLSMPRIAPNWTDVDDNLPQVLSAEMALELDDGTWKAPVDGTLFKMESDIIGVTLTGPDGAVVESPGLLLTLPPQLYLRLCRLYARILEGSNDGLPVRPVPRFFFFHGAVDAVDVSGNIHAGDDVGQSGRMTVYDTDGHPIDPLAVASALQVISENHRLLQARLIGVPFDEDAQLDDIVELAGTNASIRVRLSDSAGAPRDATNINGLGVIDDEHTANGIFTLAALSTSVSLADASDEFPAEERRLVCIGPSTNGRLTDRFTPPALPAGAQTPRRDYFTLRSLQLDTYLLGTPNTDFFGAAHEKKPAIRVNEAITFAGDGNDLLAAANDALSGSPDEALVVAQTIAADFDLPATVGPGAHWPDFPPLNGVTAAGSGSLPVNLRDSFDPAAHYVDDGDAATANVDVALTLNGLPAGAAVRVFNRKFVFDAREERGDGAGGVVPDSGTVTLLLRDPLSLRRPGLAESAISIPAAPTLRVDVAILKRTGESRIYGNVEAKVEPAATVSLTVPGPNRFAGPAAPDGLPRRGVSNAGVLGLKPPPVADAASITSLDSFLFAALQLVGETDPRDAPRLPTMARRDLIVAGHAAGNWKAVLSGGRLTAEAHSADPRHGAPGSRGGRETQLAGITSQNGRLAYDIARMAFRRTTHIVPRLIALTEARWNEPAEPGAGNGSFAAAVLQNVAPGCETPELGPLRQLIETNIGSLPDTFDELVDQVSDFVESALNDVIGRFPAGALRTEIENRRDQLIEAIGNLKDDDALSESDKERLFNELHREILSSTHGRRDTQWALNEAIANSRRFIYIETPGFATTRKDYTGDVPPYALNLLASISDRLAAAPGLHVIICTPKFPDFATGYEPFSAYEAKNRRERILAFPAERVVAFHPVGFPGRPSRIEATTVIVDDTWALVGSSTFRRRGLTFDGSSDVVLSDTNFRRHVSPAIAAFRRNLMAARLGVPASETNTFGTMPNPVFVQLNDGVQSFHAIREMLVAGGLGRIARLWNGKIPNADEITPASEDQANPDGLEFDVLAALLISFLAGHQSF